MRLTRGTMKISDYLRERACDFERKTQTIRDFRVFDFNHIPPEPLMRDEAKPIIDACLRYLASGIPNHLLVFGGRGCGKTLTVRYIGRLLESERNVHFLYVNCRQNNTSFKILAHLLGVRPRGVSLDELWQRFSGAHSAPLILVLDEVDLISDKDRRRDILYLLSRGHRPYMTIMLSNHPRFLSTLDESIRSTLQPELIHFKNYDAQQIHSILGERARTGLTQHVPSALARIASLTTRLTNADARVAIKTLYHVALEQPPEIEPVFHRARQDLVADVLGDLNDRCILMLRALIDSDEDLAKSVYRLYRRLSEHHGEEPFSYVYFYTNLAYLQSLGLILLVSTKHGRTYTNRIQRLFDNDAFSAIWHARFER